MPKSVAAGSTADAVDGTAIVDIVDGTVVPSGAADSPADTDHGPARGLPLHT